mgnify:CR=1 FL=1
MSTAKNIDEILDDLTSDESKSPRDIHDYIASDDFKIEEMIDKFDLEKNLRRKWFISELIANAHRPASDYLFAYNGQQSG